jgi:hypothetical protein
VQLIDDGVLEPQLIERLLMFDIGEHIHAAAPQAQHRNSNAGSRSGSIRSRTPPHSIT